MSAAAITAIAPTTDIRSIPCPHCGLTIPQDHSPAHRRIRELESQVKLLSTKATAAGTSSHIILSQDPHTATLPSAETQYKVPPYPYPTSH
ncbi:hypothetical protein M501DRAFT_1004981 [Patellaria atrata CBS 101060]|uniref:Uncharacterized protein n=1 Tax=Patellaria atrata CBS 101060 TaxID=1346257 RepID=A0A9P4S8Z2_9PEZI|nr:hypothetical protein M501DRAFT_1004981 [Patellaria atrata CBS 101060]